MTRTSSGPPSAARQAISRSRSMRTKVRISPAMAVALLALFVSLSGGAYAAFKLKNNSVTAKKIKNGAVNTNKIANGAVTQPKVANGAVTQANIAAGSLTGQSFKCAP